MKARAAGRRRKRVGEQARRARHGLQRTRPEHAVLARRCGRRRCRNSRRCRRGSPRATRRTRRVRLCKGEERALCRALARARTGCRCRSSHLPRRIDRAPAADDAPFEIGHRAILFRPLRGRQHDVGKLRRLGKKEVGDDEKVEALETIDDVRRVRRRDDRIRSDDEQRANAAGLARGVEQLVGRLAGTPGRSASGMPQTAAIWWRAAGSSMRR